MNNRWKDLGYIWDDSIVPQAYVQENSKSRESISSIDSGNGSNDELLICLSDIREQLGMNKNKKVPPIGYLCHLCYNHGHYIKDCTYVSTRVS